MYFFIIHQNPEYLAILISLSRFCCQIQLYSLFTKKYAISRTTKVPRTFKLLAFYQTCNKVQSVFCYIIYLSHSLFHGQVLLTFTILYVTTKLICLTIDGLASPVCPGVICMEWISGGSSVTYNLSFTISLANKSLNFHLSSQDNSGF
jgi:hypothetical protein